ncbi:MAG: hypothetical protein RI922_480 [Bacteroidota bacterium]|jgi:hypothetical protein
MKKSIFLFSLFLLTTLISFSQQTMNVKMTFTYKGAPLCFWDVTIKNGDVPLAKGKTDDKGYVEFSSVKLISLSINASGIKTTPNGEKKWDVNGYITLKDNGECKFDFEPLLQETGMPVSMMEVAWGLTLNDCMKSSSSSSSSDNSNASSSSSTTTSAAPVVKEETAQEKLAREEAERKQEAADLAATQAQGMQNSKAMYENKVANLSAKIDKKKKERSSVAAGSKEESDLNYEIRLLEIDRDMNQVKLEKTNAMIAKGNMPLNKAEKTGFNEREDALKAEEDQLKADQKAGKMFGGVAVQEQKTVQPAEKKIEEPVIKNQENKTTEKEAKETEKKETEAKEQKEDNRDSSKEEEAKEEEEEFSIASADEMSAMSLVSLHKLNIRYNSMLTNRKVSLNAKAALLRPEKKTQLEKEIAELQVAIEQLDKEIASRKKE